MGTAMAATGGPLFFREEVSASVPVEALWARGARKRPFCPCPKGVAFVDASMSRKASRTAVMVLVLEEEVMTRLRVAGAQPAGVSMLPVLRRGRGAIERA